MGERVRPRRVHLAWTAFQRRQESMRDIVGLECWFFPVAKGGRVAKLASYLWLFVKTVNQLRQASPDEVWVQLPQVPALWAALVHRALSRKTVKVVADCHNGQLRAPWNEFPLARWSLVRADVILVHNEAMLVRAEALGCPTEKLRVLEDVPAMGKEHAPTGAAAAHFRAPKPWVVFPGSFAADEPIEELLEAARRTPDYSFIITGRLGRAKQNGHDLSSAPPNVIFPGFLSLELFDDLLREADVVVGLTREEGIQLSVCNEALGFGRPLVASDTGILRKLFGKAAILVDTRSAESIAAGCRQAHRCAGEYIARSRSLAAERLATWREQQLSRVLALLSAQESTELSAGARRAR